MTPEIVSRVRASWLGPKCNLLITQEMWTDFDMQGAALARRTNDPYRVNSEVNNLEPFACLAFPPNTHLKTPQKQPIFGDQLVTSFFHFTL
jgi:hypothetical protein